MSDGQKPNPFRISYPPEVEAQLEAEARKYRDLRNQLGLAFRNVQSEAYEQWAAAMDKLGGDE